MLKLLSRCFVLPHFQIRQGAVIALSCCFLFSPLAVFAEPAEPSEAELLTKQRQAEKDLEDRTQRILEKIFGPEQSEVKASVNFSILKEVQKRAGSGKQTQNKESNPIENTKFILPGVPAPKNITKDKDPENVQKQSVEQEKEQTQINFKVVMSRREVTVFYNERLQAQEKDARQAVMALTDLKENELKFIAGKFFTPLANFWEDFMKDPKNILYSILLFLILLLLAWLFLPLSNFLASYIRAFKERAGMEVKMESTNEEELPEGAQDKDGGGGGGGFGDGELNPNEEEEGEEAMKKYIPFEYINEENLQRLLGVFRKEPPQVIALVLSYLKPDLVRAIYKELPIDMQVKVAAESSAVRQSTEQQVKMVDENIKAKIDFVVGGVDNLIKILEEVDYKIRDNILEYLMNNKPQLYEKVRASILLFDDIVNFPDLAIQTILRELKTDQLARALRNSSPEITNKIFSNMSTGGAALLKEEMEFGRQLSDEQIEEERQSILTKIKELETAGKIHIREKVKISVFESEDATSPLLPTSPEEAAETKRAGVSAQENPTNFSNIIEGENASEPQNITAAQQLYENGNYEQATQSLGEILNQDPNNVQAYILLGHCLLAQNDTTSALEYYDYAISLDPENTEFTAWVRELRQNANV